MACAPTWPRGPNSPTIPKRGRPCSGRCATGRSPPLAGIRDDKELARLPAKEQEAFRKLWADVETVLAKTRDSK